MIIYSCVLTKTGSRYQQTQTHTRKLIWELHTSRRKTLFYILPVTLVVNFVSLHLCRWDEWNRFDLNFDSSLFLHYFSKLKHRSTSNCFGCNAQDLVIHVFYLSITLVIPLDEIKKLLRNADLIVADLFACKSNLKSFYYHFILPYCDFGIFTMDDALKIGRVTHDAIKLCWNIFTTSKNTYGSLSSKMKHSWLLEAKHHHIESLVPSRLHHNGRDSVSNHQPHHCLLNPLFRRRSKKTSKLRVTGLCVGNSPGTSNAENVSIWWRRHGKTVTAVLH